MVIKSYVCYYFLVFVWLSKYLMGYHDYMHKLDIDPQDMVSLEKAPGGIILMTTLPLTIMRAATKLMVSTSELLKHCQVDFFCTRTAVQQGFFKTLLKCVQFFPAQSTCSTCSHTLFV